MVRIEERIAVDGVSIPSGQFTHHLSAVVRTINRLGLPVHPTFFETVTATALHYFADRQVDLAILEVGLGGRLDSTNIVDPVLSVITPISLDHQQYLGETLAQIAGEKAGILRNGRPALVAPQSEEVRRVLLEQAEEKGAQLEELDPFQIQLRDSVDGRYYFDYQENSYQLNVYGEFQAQNAALAIRAVEELKDSGFPIPEQSIQTGIEEAGTNGVLQKIRDHPTVFLDGGHNPSAAHQLAKFLLEHTVGPRKLVFGIMRDKERAAVLEALNSCFDEVYLTSIASQRAASIGDLVEAFPAGIPVTDPLEAYCRSLRESSTVVVAGSFHLGGEILSSISSEC
jgi:dihydrofolate synthase/folylpolyglutamate synthase